MMMIVCDEDTFFYKSSLYLWTLSLQLTVHHCFSAQYCYFNIPSIKSQVEQLYVGWPALLPVTTFSLRSFITSRANSLKA